MLVYQDLLTGDELLSDSFPYKELFEGALWEVEGKWVVKGAVDVDIGANPSAEGGEDEEGVDDQAVKVVDIVDTFRLQEQPPFEKKQFVTYMKRYIKLLTAKLEAEQQEAFKKNIEAATKFLLSKLSDLQFFVGESMHDDGSLVFAYYKDGATDPTFFVLRPWFEGNQVLRVILCSTSHLFWSASKVFLDSYYHIFEFNSASITGPCISLSGLML